MQVLGYMKYKYHSSPKYTLNSYWQGNGGWRKKVHYSDLIADFSSKVFGSG